MEKESILEKVYETAKRYELKSGGCAQCTIAAIFDVLGVEDEGVFKAATGMADGEGRYDSVFGLPGMILGAGLYAEAFPLMKQTVLTWGGVGKITLPAVLGINHWIVIVILVAAFIALFRWFEKKGF